MPATELRVLQGKPNRHSLAVPRYVRELLAWKPGDIIAFTVNPDNTVTLTKIQPPPLTRAAAELRA